MPTYKDTYKGYAQIVEALVKVYDSIDLSKVRAQELGELIALSEFIEVGRKAKALTEGEKSMLIMGDKRLFDPVHPKP